MGLADWISANTTSNTTSGPLTQESLEAFWEQLRRADENRPPPHYCDRDGHIALFCSRRCAHCGELIRELSVDENHVRLGEFW